MNPRQITEHTGFQEPDTDPSGSLSYPYDSAKDTGFQELPRLIRGFRNSMLSLSGFQGTVVGFSGTIFGLLGTRRRVIRDQTIGFSGTKPSGFQEPNRQESTRNAAQI